MRVNTPDKTAFFRHQDTLAAIKGVIVIQTRNKARLLNCLETILEMESQLRSLREAGALVTELASLRALIRDLKLEQTPLDESDIKRIELATTIFLQELKMHSLTRKTAIFPPRLLQ